MKTLIVEKALELGFDQCRITTAAPPDHAEVFQTWLQDGKHGEMGYLPRNAAKRINPDLVLPGARSIIMLSLNYGPPAPAKPSASSLGYIAGYARFTDYHHVLGGKLESLSRYLDSLAQGVKSLWYVDTGPVLERDAAQRAGLGFMGKHTNLISRGFGNWIFLSEILTTLELEPDLPEKNRCGTCQRCIAACPTAAIRAPFDLDARRCISYLTIEFRGSIPHEFRPALGARIYGCDDCLAVCPWNRFAAEAGEMKNHARSDLSEPDLLDLLNLDEPGFQKRFQGTPILRTRRRGLIRNVSVALGNIGGAEALPALEKMARNEDGLLAEHAAWAISQIRHRLSTGRAD